MFPGSSADPKTVADPIRAQPDSAWFGHPPMQLPRRQVVAADRHLTHEPGPVRYATRVFWELLRFTLPTVPILAGSAWYWLMTATADHVGGLALVLGIAPWPLLEVLRDALPL